MPAQLEHVRAEILERVLWRQAARERKAEAIEAVVEAQHLMDRAMAVIRDADGIIDEETQKIDRLLDRLVDLIPKQRDASDDRPLR